MGFVLVEIIGRGCNFTVFFFLFFLFFVKDRIVLIQKEGITLACTLWILIFCTNYIFLLYDSFCISFAHLREIQVPFYK